jgi:phosphoribosylaminoimidazole-succinocarboxamide synthase
LVVPYNLEFVFRNNAFGSFLRRYPFVQPCQNLHDLVEITTKGKAGQTDYLIVEDALAELGIMKPQEIQEAKKLTKKITNIISKEFERKGLHLVDGKIELGRIGTNDEISLIDDLSFDVMRICKSAVLDGNGNCKNFRECVEKDDKGNIRGKHILKKEEELYEIFGLKK